MKLPTIALCLLLTIATVATAAQQTKLQPAKSLTSDVSADGNVTINATNPVLVNNSGVCWAHWSASTRGCVNNASLAANRTYTLPDASGTIALLETSQTWTGPNTFSLVQTFSDGISLAVGECVAFNGDTFLCRNGASSVNTSGAFTAGGNVNVQGTLQMNGASTITSAKKWVGNLLPSSNAAWDLGAAGTDIWNNAHIGSIHVNSGPTVTATGTTLTTSGNLVLNTGSVGIGGNPSGQSALDISKSITSSAGEAWGFRFRPSYTATGNSDVIRSFGWNSGSVNDGGFSGINWQGVYLSGSDISESGAGSIGEGTTLTVTAPAFAGATNTALKVTGPTKLTGFTTNGAVPFFSGGDGTVATDNSNLCWDDTNNRLGINICNPTQALDIRNVANGAGFFVATTQSGSASGPGFVFRGWTGATSTDMTMRWDGSSIMHFEPAGASTLQLGVDAIGFYGGGPVAQPAAGTLAAITDSTGGTSGNTCAAIAAGALYAQADMTATKNCLASLLTRINVLEAALGTASGNGLVP